MATLLPQNVRSRLVGADDPHGEELGAAAVGVAERALRAPSTWCSPAWPRTCMAASAKRSMPEAPIGLDDSTPPRHVDRAGRRRSAVAPSSTIFQPSPASAKPRFSSHIGSNHENGTYISTQSISLARVGDAGLRVHVGGAVAAAERAAPGRGRPTSSARERIAVPVHPRRRRRRPRRRRRRPRRRAPSRTRRRTTGTSPRSGSGPTASSSP